MAEKSEFGRGLAICLTKFAEHFENSMARQIGNAHFFYSELKGDRRKLRKYGADVRRGVEIFDKVYLETTGSVKKGLSHLIELWANGASDHLYEIEVPKRWGARWALKRGRLGIPYPTRERTELWRLLGKLRSKGLRMGHGFTGEVHTYADFTELQELNRKIALELDKKMGLKPDLGKW